VLASLSPIDRAGLPYFEKYTKKEQLNSFDVLCIPLCDGVHFQGYIVDKAQQKILHIDSLRHNPNLENLF